MKKLTLFFLGLFLCPFLQAQSGSSDLSLQEQLDIALQHLDYNDVTTGYLKERVVPLYPVERLDGREVSDSTIISPIDANLLYEMVRGMSVTTDTLPNLHDYVDNMGYDKESDTIPLFVFRHRYNAIRPDAVTMNLLTEADGKAYDVPGRPTSPYLEDTLFVTSSFRLALDTSEVSFTLNPDFIFNNLGVSLTEVMVDFDDGNGFQTLQIGDIVSVSYPDGGEKILTIKETGNKPRVSQSRIWVKESGALNKEYALTADAVVPIDGNGDGTIDADLHIYYASCPDDGDALRKPFIYIQGFNASKGIFDLEPDELFERKLDVDFETGPNLEVTDLNTALSDAGYDLIYIDFRDGARDIRLNAASVVGILNWVNTTKAAAGSTEPNVVMGSSAGGMVGYWALRSMEVDGVDHDTEVYFTYDAQMRGANIPLCAQRFLHHIGNTRLLGLVKFKNIPIPVGLDIDFDINFDIGDFDFDLDIDIPTIENPLKTFENAIKGTAGRQFVVMNSYDPTFQPKLPNKIHGDEFINFFAELDAMGELETEWIGLSNGSKLGQLIGQAGVMNGFAMPGNKFMEFSLKISDLILTGINLLTDGELSNGGGSFLSGLFGLGLKVEGELYYVQDYSTDLQKVYDGRSGFQLLPFFGIGIWNNYEYEVRGKPAYDTSPGGLAGVPITLADNLFPSVDFKHLAVCIAPTISVLGIDGYDFFQDVSDENGVVQSPDTPVDGYAASDRATTQYGISQHNQEHGSMSNQIGNRIKNRLVPLSATNDDLVDQNTGESVLDNRTYNVGIDEASTVFYEDNGIFPLPQLSINSRLSIINNGSLLLNADDLIGFTDDPTNPQKASPLHADISFGSDVCSEEGLEVYIKEGSLRVGDISTSLLNTADLYVNNEAMVRVGGSGELIVSKQSTVFIEDQSQIIVEDGGLIKTDWHSQIVVESGGVLRVQSGGRLRLMHNAQLWVKPGGQLILEDGARVQLWDGPDPGGRANIKLGGPVDDPADIADVPELLLDGTFEFSGNGFFDFHRNQNIELVGSTNFDLTGKGRDYRFIRTSGGSLGISKNQLNLQDGLVEVAGGVVELTGSAEGRTSNVVFRSANEGGIGIYANGADYLFCNQTDFINLKFGARVNGLTQQIVGTNALFNDCKFLNNESGLALSNMQSAQIWGGEFDNFGGDPSGTGVWGINVDNLYLKGCTMNNQVQGVVIEDRTNLSMQSGIIQNSEIGILASGSSGAPLGNSNIDLTAGATIQNNYCGIFVDPFNYQSAQVLPMLTLDCANILDNIIGIRGRNFLMNMDAGGEVASNEFSTSSTNSYSINVQVCYDNNIDISEVEATHNYWESNSQNKRRIWKMGIGGTCTYIDPLDDLPAPNLGIGNIPLVTSPELPTPPEGCSSPNDPGTPTGEQPSAPHPSMPDFNVKVSGCETPSEEVIYKLYWDAYDEFLTESEAQKGDRTVSKSAFGQIAVIPEGALDSYSNTCKMLVQKARSRSGLLPAQSMIAPTMFDTPTISAQLTAVPNPAKDQFSVAGAAPGSELIVLDQYGKQIAQQVVNDQTIILTESWQTGIYFLQTTDTETGATKYGKVLVAER